MDKAIEVVKSSGVPFQVGAMETTMKGELDHLLKIVKAAQQACLDVGAIEVITNIKIHNRKPDAVDTFCTYDRGVTPANAVFIEKQKLRANWTFLVRQPCVPCTTGLHFCLLFALTEILYQSCRK